MKKTLTRIFCALLALMLLPLSALAEVNLDEPLYRSDFTVKLAVHNDGFPKDGAAHYKAWEKFLNKLSISGTMDVQRPLEMMDQYVDIKAALNVKGKEVIPFRYESFGISRYITSPMLRGDTIYLQMLNFDLFMLKPYFFMELPTPFISMLIFPEQLFWVEDQLAQQVKTGLEGKTTLTYDELYELASNMSMAVMDDEFARYYYVCYGLFALIYGSDIAYGDLCGLQDIVDLLDPEQKGLQLVCENGTTSCIIGNHEVLRADEKGWEFKCPDINGYEHSLTFKNDAGTASVIMISMLDGDERLNVSAVLTGLPQEGGLSADGTLTVEIGGGAIQECFKTEKLAVKLGYHYAQSSQLYPRAEELQIDLIHPQTDKPCITFRYQADVEETTGTEEMNHRKDYRYLADFFTLNTVSLSEFKSRYFKGIAISALPVAIEMPVGVIGDVIGWFQESGFMAFFGIE